MKVKKFNESKIINSSSTEYRWVFDWISHQISNFTLSSSFQLFENAIIITIYYDGDTWNGINGVSIEEITNFYKYLISNKIISSEEQFKLSSRGQFIILLDIDKYQFENNEELLMYKNSKKYNL